MTPWPGGAKLLLPILLLAMSLWLPVQLVLSGRPLLALEVFVGFWVLRWVTAALFNFVVDVATLAGLLAISLGKRLAAFFAAPPPVLVYLVRVVAIVFIVLWFQWFQGRNSTHP